MGFYWILLVPNHSTCLSVEAGPYNGRRYDFGGSVGRCDIAVSGGSMMVRRAMRGSILLD